MRRRRRHVRIRPRALVTSLVLLLVLGAGVLARAESSRIARGPGELIVALAGEPGPATSRLLEAFRRDRPDLSLEAIQVPADPRQLARLLNRGDVDVVLLVGPYQVEGEAVPPALLEAWLVPGEPFWEAVVPVVRFLHPLRELTAAEGRALLEGRAPEGGGAQPCFPLRLMTAAAFLDGPAWDGISLLAPEQLNVAVQALAVGGVAPTTENLATGAYPLSRPLHVLVRSSGRPLGWNLAWPQPVLRRYEPNLEALQAFLGFLDTAEAHRAASGEGRAVTLAAVGDIMLARGVGRLVAEQGPHYPFDLVRDRVQAADVGFANLESPLGTSGQPLPGKVIWFRADPAAAEGLARSGFGVLTLANNHILDYDSELLLDTLDLLDRHGLAYTGAGRNLEEAMRPVLFRAGDLTLAFLGFSDFAHIYWSVSYPRTFAATATRPGVAPADPVVVAQAIALAKEEADFVIAAFHWGDEYVNYPNADQLRMGRHAVEAGADIVLGSHPHAVQGFELYQGGFIAYSLGNFIMDQRKPIQVESMILEIEFTSSGIRQVRVLPARIEEHRPAILDGDAAVEALEKLRRISLSFLGN
ncbi:MAG: CapA family protein [bacterium]|nr:CapA family protein [bacterium]